MYTYTSIRAQERVQDGRTCRTEPSVLALRIGISSSSRRRERRQRQPARVAAAPRPGAAAAEPALAPAAALLPRRRPSTARAPITSARAAPSITIIPLPLPLPFPTATRQARQARALRGPAAPAPDLLAHLVAGLPARSALTDGAAGAAAGGALPARVSAAGPRPFRRHRAGHRLRPPRCGPCPPAPSDPWW